MSKLIKTLLVLGGAGAGYALVRHFTADASNSSDKPGSRATDTHTPERQLQTPERRPQILVAPKPPSPTSPQVPQSKPLLPSPTTGPTGPLAEPTHPKLKTRLTRSSTDESMTVVQTPLQLLAQAHRIDPTITLDELTGARLAVSEHGRGTFTELCCIIDAEVNRAKRRKKTLYESLTYRGTFGRQGRHRRASTRQDPTMRHLLAARAVLSGPARGISRGAKQFFDPRAMVYSNRKYRKWLANGKKGKSSGSSCDALSLLEAWSFAYPKKGRTRCPPDRSRPGSHTLAWVGPIDGVDATRLMLMERMRPGEVHTRRYEAARALLTKRLPKP